MAVILTLRFLLSLGQGITFTTMYATATTGTADERQDPPAVSLAQASKSAERSVWLSSSTGLAILVNVTTAAGSVTQNALAGIMLVLSVGIILGIAEARSGH